MSAEQRRQLADVLLALVVYGMAFHHGAAVGADIAAAELAESFGYRAVPHPAHGQPLARNRAIVAASDLLIAAPESDTEQRRSGTWATVRYARQKGIPVIMLSRGTR